MRIKTALVVLLLIVVLAAMASDSPGSLVLIHATVVDVRTGELLPAQTIIITGGRITKISKQATVPANSHVVDCAGQFVIPGLWDMHAHALWSIDQIQRMFNLFLANGVTGIRDMGSPLPVPETLSWRAKTARGSILGPHIVAAGKLVDGPKPVWPDSVSTGTAEEAREAVRTLHREGVDFIKVYSRLPRDAYFALADEARREGIPYAGHVPIYVSAREASVAGQRSIEHLSEILFACSDKETDLREQLVATTIGGERDQVRKRQMKVIVDSFSQRKATELAQLFASNKTWQVPTLLVQYTYAYVDPSELRQSSGIKYVPSGAVEGWVDRLNGFRRSRDESDMQAQKRSYDLELDTVRMMRRYDVHFMIGTDAETFYPAGFGLHKELSFFVSAGFSTLETLQAATLNPATYLGRQKDMGTVESGKIADLVILDANPLANIENTKRVAGVIVGGRYFDRQGLNQLLTQAGALATNKR
jgi:Amidohydrolase family